MIATERRDLAMACGTAGRYANRRNLLSQHGRFLLSQEDAARLLDNIVEIVRNSWRSILRRAGISKTDCKTIAATFLYEGFFYECERLIISSRTSRTYQNLRPELEGVK
jgi:serine/threonine-protein kinase HipA